MCSFFIYGDWTVKIVILRFTAIPEFFLVCGCQSQIWSVKMKTAIIQKLTRTITQMIVLGIFTFLTGFLKGTPFEHLSILLFLLLAGFGIHLFYITKNSAINNSTTFFLLLTSASTILFILLIEVAIVKMVLMNFSLSDGLESLEGFFYLISGLFSGGVIGSIICLKISST